MLKKNNFFIVGKTQLWVFGSAGRLWIFSPLPITAKPAYWTSPLPTQNVTKNPKLWLLCELCNNWFSIKLSLQGSILFSCSWNCHVPECWRGAPCHHDHAHHDHDQSWLIMTNHDQLLTILTNPDQLWPIMTNHYHLIHLIETWVLGRRSLPRTSFNLLYWSSRPSWTSFHLQI